MTYCVPPSNIERFALDTLVASLREPNAILQRQRLHIGKMDILSLAARDVSAAPLEWASLCCDVLSCMAARTGGWTPTERIAAAGLHTRMAGVRANHFDVLRTRGAGTWGWSAADTGWIASGALLCSLHAELLTRTADAFRLLDTECISTNNTPLNDWGRWEVEQAMIRLSDVFRDTTPDAPLAAYTTALEVRAVTLSLTQPPDITYVRYCSQFFYDMAVVMLLHNNTRGLPALTAHLTLDTSEMFRDFFYHTIAPCVCSAGARSVVHDMALLTSPCPGDVAHFVRLTGDDAPPATRRVAQRLHSDRLSNMRNALADDTTGAICRIGEGSTAPDARLATIAALAAFNAYLYVAHDMRGWMEQYVLLSPRMSRPAHPVLVLNGGGVECCVGGGSAGVSTAPDALLVWINALHGAHLMGQWPLPPALAALCV